MKQITYIIFLFAFAFCFDAEAQTSNALDLKNTGENLKKMALEGTYQIMFLKNTVEPVAITDELLQQIEAARDAIEIKYIKTEKYTIKIISSTIIQDPAYVPVEEYIFVEHL